MHIEDHFVHSFDQTKIHIQVRENSLTQWLIVLHGLGEYASRHQYFQKMFSHQYNLVYVDLRGHGQSEGRRGWIGSFDHYLKDLDAVFCYLHSHYKISRFSLYGHSLGALIVCKWLQLNFQTESSYPERVFLSSPPLKLKKTLSLWSWFWPRKVNKLVSQFSPEIPLSLILKFFKLSHDGRVLPAFLEDQKNLKKIHPYLLQEVYQQAHEISCQALRVRCPLAVALGEDDFLLDAKNIVKYFAEFAPNARILLVPQAYHELSFEVERFKRPFFEFLTSSLSS
jgi:acylglycerol lipase